MTTSVLRPNATNIDHADWTRTGGTTKHGVTSDDSDATYIENATSPGGGITVPITFGLGTFALGTGRMRTMAVRVRGLYTGNPQTVEVQLLTASGTVAYSTSVDLNTTSFAVFATAPAAFAAAIEGGVTEQVAIDGLQLRIAASAAGGGDAARVAELYADLMWAAIPVANITYPTGTPVVSATNRPTYTWTHTPGSDGGSQSFYEVKVFTAAQYGAGGFSPDTSTSFWTSGIVVGSATSQLSGVLANSTTYRVYVRTAQTINGAAHWSAWDFEGFSVAVTTADVSAITTTADNTFGRILIAVDRSGAAWDFVEVQRSFDAGTTWAYVRGGEYVVPSTATVFSTGDASNFDIYDYETGNGTTAIYRARATRIVSDLPITGAWVQSTPAVSWTSTRAFLKDPYIPALNKAVLLVAAPEPAFPRRRSVLAVLGRPNPVVVSDVLGGASGQLWIQTETTQAATDLMALLNEPLLLLQLPVAMGWGSRFIAPGGVRETRLDARVVNVYRRFEVEYDEVDAPPDALAGIH